MLDHHIICLSMVGRGISRCWGRSIICGLMGMSVVKFLAHLFGESELNGLAGRGTQSGNTFLSNDYGIFNSGNLDGSLFGQVSASNNWQVNGFVDTGLHRGRVGNSDGDIDGGDNGHIVGSCLGNFLAVVVSITTMSMSVSTISLVSGLADSDHLDIFFLLKGDLNSLGSGFFFSCGIRVAADFLGNNFDCLDTDSTDNGVGEVYLNDDFDGQFNSVALSYDDGSTHFSRLNNIEDRAVVFGLFIAITMSMTVSRGRVIRSGGIAVSRLSFLSCWDCGSEGEEEGQDSECLHV